MRLGTSEPVPPAFFSCWRHLPGIATLEFRLPGRPPSPLRCRDWVAYASRQKPPIPISNNIDERCVHLFLRSSDFPTPSTYPCEDISNYYSPVKHLRLRGEALKRQLNSIIAPHHSLSYRKVWGALKVLDAADIDNPDASSGIVEIYSLRVVPKRLSGKPQGWNREHLWPRSYGLTNGPSFTDLHNIRPADINVNSSRGNKYYGECITSSTKCLRPANKEAALDTETDKERWTPPMQVRGDIARALMYMAVCYGFQQPGGSPGLRLSDAPNVENREMGLLSTLLKWNEVDPPSREEKLRNERICKFYQRNRNPFVDHPEYANLIWKQAVSRQAPYNKSNNSDASLKEKELGMS
ncbi:Extracellular ribonuclease [Spatholobus suberectus]|nr:Extracellular ribonuclease [Spatholobus suberectus]